VAERSGIYALGLVLFELFAGKYAFEGKNRRDLVNPFAVTDSRSGGGAGDPTLPGARSG